jgi:hypothetical protein
MNEGRMRRNGVRIDQGSASPLMQANAVRAGMPAYRGLRPSMHVYTRDKAALRQSVMYPGERKSVWELFQALRSSKPQSRNRMMPYLWATRQAEIGRDAGMER